MDKQLCWGHLSEAGEYLRNESPISSLVWYILLQSQPEGGLSKGYLLASNKNINNNEKEIVALNDVDKHVCALY